MKNENSFILDNSNNDSRVFFSFEYLYVFVLIIYGGMANSFVRSFSFDKPLSVLLPVILSIILALKNRIAFSKSFYLLLLFYTIYNFALIVKFEAIHPIFFGYLLVNFFVTYVTVKALKFKFFFIYERIIYYLAIIGLIFWLGQIILGGDNLLKILYKIPSIETFSNVSGGGLNIIIYSVQPFEQILIQNSRIFRNCGFAWEPGGFAVLLCLAIFINLFFRKSSLKLNSRYWILVFALLTTQSTTGYIILIILMIFYFFQAKMKVVILLLPALITIVILFFSLPFMRDKILLYFEEANQVDVIVEQSIGRETTRTPQRFASFIIALKDFVNNPILGYGGQTEDRWFRQINSNISPISGIGNLLAQYGMVGFLFFTLLLIRSSKYFACSFNYHGAYLFFLIMILITISYSVIFLSVIMSFWMFSFYRDPEEIPDVSEYQVF